jgi:hypothetical protein
MFNLLYWIIVVLQRPDSSNLTSLFSDQGKSGSDTDFTYKRKIAPKDQPQQTSAAAAAIQQVQAVSSDVTTNPIVSNVSVSNTPQYLIHAVIEAFK